MEITQSVVGPMMALWTKVGTFIPNLLAAIAILVIGYFVAKMLAALFGKLLNKVDTDKWSEKAGISGVLRQGGFESSVSQIVSQIIFWLLMLLFLLSAIETLGLTRVSATVDDFILYLPKVLGAALVIIFGLVVAHFLRGTVRSAAEGMGFEYAKGLATAVYGTLVVIVATLAIGQLEIETQLLNNAVLTILVAVGASVALSLGLGTRDITGNIIAGIYARDLYKPGISVQFNGVTGKIVEVGTTKTTIEAQGKRLSIANRQLIDETVEIITGGGARSAG